MMHKIKISSMGALLLTCYFTIAPVYYQPVLPDGAWVAIKMGFLGVFALVSVIGVARNRYFVFGLDDFVFFLVILASFPSLYKGVGVFYSIVLGYAFYLLGRSQHYTMPSETLSKSLIWSCRLSIIYVVYVMLQMLKGFDLYDVTRGVNANSFALYLTTLAAVLFFSYDRTHNIVDAAGLILLGAAVLYTGSRGGLLILCAMFLIYLVFNREWKKAIVVVAFFFVGLLVLSELNLFQDFRVYQQYQRHIQGEEFDLSSGRLPGYKVAIDLFLASPVDGVGSVDLKDHGLGYTQVHNFYIRSLAEGGLMLFIPLMVLVICLVVKVFNSKNLGGVLKANTMALLFIPLLYEPNGLFGNFMIAGLLWFVIGYQSASVRPQVVK